MTVVNEMNRIDPTAASDIRNIMKHYDGLIRDYKDLGDLHELYKVAERIGTDPLLASHEKVKDTVNEWAMQAIDHCLVELKV